MGEATNEVPRQIVHSDFPRMHSDLTVNQRLTASSLSNAFAVLPEDVNGALHAFVDGGGERMKRRICPAVAFADCVNELYQKPVVGLDNQLSVASILRKLSEYHGKVGLSDDQGKQFPRWEVFREPDGFLRFQAVVSAARGLGLAADTIENCPIPVMVDFLQNGGKVALSVNNTFVQDITDPQVDRLKPDGHVIALLGIKKGQTEDPMDYIVDVADPYADPSQPSIMRVPFVNIAPYMRTDSNDGKPVARGMVFAKGSDALAEISHFRAPNTIYPTAVIQDMHDYANGQFAAQED